MKQRWSRWRCRRNWSPYYSLAAGFLTCKYRSQDDLSKSPRGQGVKKFLNDRGFRILQGLDTVAAEHKATPAQVALAWLMARPSITAPIASATSVEQLNDLAKATRLELSTDCVILPRIYADEHGSEFWFDVCGKWTCPLLRQRVAKDMTFASELLRA
jgi:aryl-alcohol dehydrogenase-like predicted oxidoreductase